MPDLKPVLGNLLAILPAVLGVILGTIAMNTILSRGMRLLAGKTSFTDSDVAPFLRLGRWVVNGAGVVLLLGLFGFNLGGLWAMLATVLGLVAIGFVAVWSVLSNISCTLIILIFRPFEVGDEIEFPGEPTLGKVIDLNFVYTTLLASDGSLFQIPNNLFLQKIIRRRRGRGGAALSEQLTASRPADLA
jgi:small-conductance mechanosensitive channel